MANEHDKLVIRFPTNSSLIDGRIFRHHYVRRLLMTGSPSQTFPIPDEMQQFLIWYGRAELSTDYYPDGYAKAKERADEAWRQVRRDNKKRHQRSYVKLAGGFR